MTTPRKWFSMAAGADETAPARIDIYGEIGGWGMGAKDFADGLKALGTPAAIEMHVHSPGGDVVEGNAIHNILREHAARKVCIVDGLAASMASVIAMAADEIRMPANALMLIHNPWTSSAGDAAQLRNDAEVLDRMARGIRGAYVRKTGKSDDDIRAIMDAETWMDGNEALAAGFCDKVTDGLRAVAAVDLGKYTAKIDARVLALMEKPVESEPPPVPPVETPPPPQVDPPGDVLAAEFERGRIAGRNERSAEIAAEMGAAQQAIVDSRTAQDLADKTAREIADERDRLAAELATAKADAAKARGERDDQQKRHAALLGGFRFAPEVTWADALAKCGKDYARARKEYPQAYEAFMAAKTNREGQRK